MTFLTPFSVLWQRTAFGAFLQEALDMTGAAQEINGTGWHGFFDVPFLGRAILALSLAALLGSIIAYHPMSRRTMDSIEEAEASRIYIMYSVIGALIGIMVMKYGMVVGFVVFGIGGLIRFRTRLRSVRNTSRVIFVTLIGLSSGLDLPHVAVLATGFGFLLISIIDLRITYRVVIKGLKAEQLAAASDHYRKVLVDKHCRVLGEKKSLGKKQIAFVFRASRNIHQEDLEALFTTHIPKKLQGITDWERD